MSSQNNTFDVIVVGSGPGGATVAKELCAEGKKVLILEWGPNPVLKGSFLQFARHALVPGKSLLITGQMLGLFRGIITGGSSVFYYGTCFKVPEKMLSSYGIDISQEIAQTRQELPIAPLKDEMVTPMSRRIMSSAQDLGYNWDKFDKFMYQDRWRPEHKFGYYGDPNDVKWSAKMYVEQALENGATIINNAKVSKVIMEGNSACGVAYRTGFGKKHKAYASKIVICAGGIGSPVILRNSGIERAGYDFFFDPLISVCGTVNDIKAGNEIPMSTGILLEDEGYMMTDMSVPPILHMMFEAEVLKLHRMFSQKKTLRIMIKARDTLGGEISKGGGVKKMLSKQDRQRLLNGYKRATSILSNAGAKNIHKTWYFAAHPGGTVKIGELIDSDLKTQFDNLYVCDCSVIPEAWGLPPTLTLICLGKRLAKHLCNT